MRQSLGQTLLAVAADMGIPVGWEEGGIFEALYRARLPKFLEANRAGASAVDAFYVDLASDWLQRIGSDPATASELQRQVDELAFGSSSPMFSLYPDSLPCLEACRAQGLKIGVISNWDVSLHRVLAMFGITPLIDVAIASLEFGHEKPDPRIFDHTLEQLGAAANEAMHIGDDPADDVDGPISAGMSALFLDRSSVAIRGQQITSLTQVIEELAWRS